MQSGNKQRLLLGSGGYRTEAMRARWQEGLDVFLEKRESFVFVPYALAAHGAYVEKIVEFGFHAGREVVGLHTCDDPAKALREAEAIFVGGGNSFRLLDTCQRMGILPVIAERVRAGVPYIGISAGTNLACPTIMTTNDMPIVQPRSLDALGLLPLQINPHYVAGRLFKESEDGYEAHGGETRDERIREYHELNALPVLGLYEGVALEVQGRHARLWGEQGARLFEQGKPAQELPPRSELSGLL